MSWKISGLVWEIDLTHSQQSILLAMAEHAEHDGSKVFPSVARIAWKTNYSDRQVRRVMSELREMKILVIAKESNRYRPREYKINISAGKKKKPFRADIVSSLGDEEDSTPTSRTDMGVIPEPSDLTPESTRADIATATRADIAMSADSSLTVNESSLKDSRSKTERGTNNRGIKKKHDKIRGALEKQFIDSTNLDPPLLNTIKQKNAAGTLWWDPLREIAKLAKWDELHGCSLISRTVQQMRRDKLTISSPKSILNVAKAIEAEGRTAHDPYEEKSA